VIYCRFLLNLAATLLVEGLIIALWFHRRDYVYYSVLCNLLTNPSLNLALLIAVRRIGGEYYTITLAVLEIAAVLAEAFVLRLLCRFRPAKALLVSCTMNAGSLLAGMLVYGLGVA